MFSLGFGNSYKVQILKVIKGQIFCNSISSISSIYCPPETSMHETLVSRWTVHDVWVFLFYFFGRSSKNVSAGPKTMHAISTMYSRQYCALQASMTWSDRLNAGKVLHCQNTCQIKGKFRYPVSRTALPTYLVIFPVIDSRNLPSPTIKKQRNAPR